MEKLVDPKGVSCELNVPLFFLLQYQSNKKEYNVTTHKLCFICIPRSSQLQKNLL